MKARLTRILRDSLKKMADRLLPPVPGSIAGVPLVFGVTGHRDLRVEDMDRLRTEVRKRLMEYRSAFPTTPFLVLSCLAEGADRLVAEEALAVPSTRLAAVLPMAVKDYETDFEAPSSREQFRYLLEQSAYVRRLGPDHDEPLTGQARDESYRSAGYYVARSCHVLIALWDGVHNNKTGGTADVVRKKLNGSFVSDTGTLGVQDTLAPPESGRVLHFVTPRISSSTGNFPADPLSNKVLVRSETKEHEVLSHSEAGPFSDSVAFLTEEFNRSVAGQKLDWRTASAETIAKAPAEVQAALTQQASMTIGLRELADLAATRIKNRYATVAVLNIALGIAAMFLFQIKIIFESYTIGNVFLAVWIAVIAFVWTAFIAIKGLRIKYRQHEYRALAEALRVSGYWRVLQLPQPVADVFLVGHQGSLDWIRKAIRTAALIDELEGEKRSGEQSHVAYPSRSSYAHRDWVKDQCAYFFGTPAKPKPGAVERDRISERNTRRVTYVILGLTVASLALFPVANFIGGGLAEVISKIALLIVSTAPQSILAIEIYLDLRAFSVTANRTESIGKWMQRADAFLDKASHEPEITAPIFERLGREALNETSDWLILHSSRELRPL